jgi:hypothetical protein
MSPTELRLEGELDSPRRGFLLVGLILLVILGGLLVSAFFDLGHMHLSL